MKLRCMVYVTLQGFDHHVKHDHNMWMYIYFSIYLDTIDISDHNAIEKYVYEMVSIIAERISTRL